MKLDPDERVPVRLLQEITKAIYSKSEYAGYWVPLRLWFLGKPLHVYSKGLRLWQTGKCSFSNVVVNERSWIDGKVGHLKESLEHHDRPDLQQWLNKQNLYSTMEAMMKIRDDKLAAKPRIFGSYLERRMFLKNYFDRLPFRYLLLWLYYLLYEGVWRDGTGGFAWAHLRVAVLRMKELKVLEMKKTGRIPEIPRSFHGEYDPRIINSPLQRLVCGN